MEKKINVTTVFEYIENTKKLIAKIENKKLIEIEKLENRKKKTYTTVNIQELDNKIEKIKKELKDNQVYYFYLESLYMALSENKRIKVLDIKKINKYHIEVTKILLSEGLIIPANKYINRDIVQYFIKFYYQQYPIIALTQENQIPITPFSYNNINPYKIMKTYQENSTNNTKTIRPTFQRIRNNIESSILSDAKYNFALCIHNKEHKFEECIEDYIEYYFNCRNSYCQKQIDKYNNKILEEQAKMNSDYLIIKKLAQDTINDYKILIQQYEYHITASKLEKSEITTALIMCFERLLNELNIKN